MISYFFKIEECSEAEDEYNCDWHKDSSIPEIANFEEFSKQDYTQHFNKGDCKQIQVKAVCFVNLRKYFQHLHSILLSQGFGCDFPFEIQN